MQIIVKKIEHHRHHLGSDETNCCTHNDSALAYSCQYCTKQIRRLCWRAAYEIPFAGNDLKGKHVVGLDTKARSRAADAAYAQCAPNGQVHVVSQYRRGESLLSGGIEQLRPQHSCPHD